MSHEIADSEEESDHIAPLPKRSVKQSGSSNAAPPSTAEQDPLLNTDFGEFLSPTQRISQFDGNNDNDIEPATSHILDSSTDRFLNEVAPLPPPSSPQPDKTKPGPGTAGSDMGDKKGMKTQAKENAGKKRSRTEIEDVGHVIENTGSAKRSKSHGTVTSSKTKSSSFADFQTWVTGTDINQNSLQAPADAAYLNAINGTDRMISIEARTDYTSPLDLSLSLDRSNGDTSAEKNGGINPQALQRQLYAPPQPCTPGGSFFGANLQGGTASHSSIGNYQSFNIGTNGVSIDFDYNPFGRLSQAPLNEDLDSEETRGIAEIFRNASYTTKNNAKCITGQPEDLFANVSADMRTSPLKAGQSLEAPEVMQVEENVPQASPLFSPITNPEENDGDTDVPELPAAATGAAHLDDEHHKTVGTSVKPPPKKRGRPAKQKKAEEFSGNDRNDIDELQLDQPHNPRATRAGTVDSVSNVSEISQATTGSRTGRKRKARKTDMAPPELQSKKLPSSDLGLDNKAVIGLSPERYVPRSSRRRGRAEPEPEPEPEPETEVPRTEQHESSVSKQSIAQDERPPSQEPPIKPTQSRAKKGKKVKAKRAKTSAAALLQRSTDFLDEDEKEEAQEVIYMDERPAKIKFDPMPDFSPDRKPQRAELDDEDEDVVKSADLRAKVSVNIPVLSKSDDDQDFPPPVPEPKKRGRKRKKPIGEPVEQAEEDIEERPALVEKDTNVITMPGKRIKARPSQPQDELEGADKSSVPSPRTVDEENNSTELAVSTPSKSRTTSTTPVPTTSAKPTHSPLKPSSTSKTPLFNARTRIGLSKRHSIPSLLRKVDRNKEAPKAIERKEKLSKTQLAEREMERIAREEAEAEGREYVAPDVMRDKHGNLVEWDF